jgi:hypothetical protein
MSESVKYFVGKRICVDKMNIEVAMIVYCTWCEISLCCGCVKYACGVPLSGTVHMYLYVCVCLIA